MPLIILNIVLPLLAMICFVIAWRLSVPTSGTKKGGEKSCGKLLRGLAQKILLIKGIKR